MDLELRVKVRFRWVKNVVQNVATVLWDAFQVPHPRVRAVPMLSWF